MIKFLWVFLALALMACSKSTDQHHPDDFNVTVLQDPAPAWVRPTDCRENIRKVICLVDPVPENNSDKNANLTRPCDPQHSLDYAAAFEELYDSYPEHLQKMFCSLRRIFVERGFFGSAYAGAFRDPQNRVIAGAVIGVRQTLIENPFSISAWATWKEQLNFGGDPLDYTIKLPYPKLDVPGESGHDFMSFVFAHEFGHLFDFKNKINQYSYEKACEKTDSCPAVAGTWASLSWSTPSTHLATSDFAHQSGLCFYDCKTTLSPALAPELYESFQAVNFMSTYASTNSWDDFAETLAYHYLKTTLKKPIVLTYGAGLSYDATARLESPQMKLKLDFVEHFLNSAPAYP